MATSGEYRHTQVGTVMIVALGLPALAVAAAAAAGALPMPFLALGAVFLVCLALFGSLTVEVDHVTVSLRFGVGLIRRRFALAEVRTVETVRNRWFYGLGIRMLSRGWLYNVSGLDAVEIGMTDGGAHRIGTDEPGALAAAIQRARGLAD
jgi:hypothetical protein